MLLLSERHVQPPACHHSSTPGWRSPYSQLLPGEESTCLKFEFASFVMSRGCLFPNKLHLVTT